MMCSQLQPVPIKMQWMTGRLGKNVFVSAVTDTSSVQKEKERVREREERGERELEKATQLTNKECGKLYTESPHHSGDSIIETFAKAFPQVPNLQPNNSTHSSYPHFLSAAV